MSFTRGCLPGRRCDPGDSGSWAVWGFPPLAHPGRRGLFHRTQSQTEDGVHSAFGGTSADVGVVAGGGRVVGTGVGLGGGGVTTGGFGGVGKGGGLGETKVVGPGGEVCGGRVGRTGTGGRAGGCPT